MYFEKECRRNTKDSKFFVYSQKQHLHPELKSKVCFLFLDVFVKIHDRLDQMFYKSKGNKRKAEINWCGTKNAFFFVAKVCSKKCITFWHMEIYRIQMGEQNLGVSLNTNNASYHHSCKNAYNNRMYELLIEKEKTKY